MQDFDDEKPSSEELAFRDAYENTLQFLENRIKLSNLALSDLEGELHHLTIYEGQDWGGRGELKNSEIQGQIYAYLAVIDRVKKNKEKPKRG
ncbi:hypothetical protein [Sphaerochaeta sp. PS]|uniref:hypothetical protein n=1 Tax=Sphaerochaeta sp. PS TaxID=3076336 RepID=UPI0028A4D4F0|nr:hypothetical protein [Sphaerochaeta sp. PS]MDT4762076.1 hypothetical protein [Sphaerochaeta sp. PS]